MPLEDAIQPSGQSVALQAMACGRSVVLSRTRGLWTGDDYQSGRDLVLVEHGSPDALCGAMQQLLDDAAHREHIGRAAREAVLLSGRIESFADRLGSVITGAANS